MQWQFFTEYTWNHVAHVLYWIKEKLNAIEIQAHSYNIPFISSWPSCTMSMLLQSSTYITMRHALTLGHWTSPQLNLFTRDRKKEVECKKTWIFVSVKISKENYKLSQESAISCGNSCTLIVILSSTDWPQKFKWVACYCCCFSLVLGWQLVFPLVMM